MGGLTGYSCPCGKYIASWNYLSAEQYFPELRAVRAILSGYFRGRKNTTWNFMSLAQYDRPLRLASLGKENRRSRWSHATPKLVPRRKSVFADGCCGYRYYCTSIVKSATPNPRRV
jgi:hypothetical protein